MKFKAGWIYKDNVEDFLYVHKIIGDIVYYDWLTGSRATLKQAIKELPRKKGYTQYHLKEFKKIQAKEILFVHTPLQAILNYENKN